MNEAKDYINSPVSNSPELSLVKEITKEHQEQYHQPTKTKKLSKTQKRFYAFNVDLYAIIIMQKICVYSYITFVNQSFELAPFAVKKNLLGNLNQMYLSTLMFTYFSYFLVSFYLGHGKTIGQTIFDLRTVSHEGSPKELSFMESFMRTLGYTLNYLFLFLPFLMNLVRKDKRGLPDFFSQTEVMTENEFLHYEHSLKTKLAEKEAAEKQSIENKDADILNFPIPEKKVHFEKKYIDEHTQQLDLFFS